ncbi:MAG: LacI family transcriptional regulator [Cellulomonadaceae bacterium]|nr:LacI family transcriptional regulator [Cellulomonadaceae bacterium]
MMPVPDGVANGQFTSQRGVTIHDVAREAGVSPATVSKVMNNRYGVASATQARVKAAVTKLGYEASLVASSMRRSSSNTIGVLLAGFDPFATEVIKGISAEAVGKGYELLAYSGAIADERAVGWEHRSIQRLGGSLIDAAIVMTPTIRISGTAIPIVTVDPPAGLTDSATIASDNLAGAREATKHLIDLGHVRIAHIRGRTDLLSAQLREQGYVQALAEARLPYDPSLTLTGAYRRDWAVDCARKLLDLPYPPTAIFCANDWSALGVYDVCAERGLRIPEDLSVIGFDDIPEGHVLAPPLTTIAQNLPEIGADAFRLIRSMLDGGGSDNITVATTLMHRGSTGPVPA